MKDFSPKATPLDSQLVKRLALDTGFDACGLAEAGPVDPAYLDTYDHWLASGGNADMDYLVRHRDLRSHPANLLPGTRTVICLLLGYKCDALVRGVAQYAYPPDYHDRLRHLLHTLAARLKEAYPGIECRPCVDSAPLPEKYWAIRAGLGWRGRNTLLVNPTLGTFCNLGELLVTLPADRYDTPLPNGCPPDCHACLTACPNAALQHTPSPLRGTPPNLGGEPKKPAPAHSSPKLGEVAQRAGGVCSTLTADLCTAYNTIENRSPELPADLHTAGYAFGCDLCQLACPYNRTAPARYHLTPERRADLESLATADEQQFKRITKNTAMSRITYSQWLRNLRKALPLLLILSFQFSIPNSLSAQSYQARFETAIEARDTVAQRAILSQWHAAAPHDPDLYIARYNYYIQRNEPAPANSPAGRGGMTTPTTTDSALIVLSQAVDTFPDRLDLRLGLAYHLSAAGQYDALAGTLVATLDHSEEIKHRWLYPNVSQETTAEILLEALADHLALFFDLATETTPDPATRQAPANPDDLSPALRQLRWIAKRTAQVFPSNVQALNFLAVSYTLEGDYKKALRFLKRAEAIDPDDPVVRQNIADLQQKVKE